MFIIGIDEVGRGPLAGPVTVGAVAIPVSFVPNASYIRAHLRDSKRLTERAREEWCAYIRNEKKIFLATASVVPNRIDALNIANATNLAAARALRMLLIRNPVIKKAKLFVDAGIKVRISEPHTSLILSYMVLIRGDELIPAIMLASIAAKVRRDRYMRRQAKNFPAYGFDKHKGYGTRDHLRALERHGPCSIHRLTFIRKYSKF